MLNILLIYLIYKTFILFNTLIYILDLIIDPKK